MSKKVIGTFEFDEGFIKTLKFMKGFVDRKNKNNSIVRVIAENGNLLVSHCSMEAMARRTFQGVCTGTFDFNIGAESLIALLNHFKVGKVDVSKSLIRVEDATGNEEQSRPLAVDGPVWDFPSFDGIEFNRLPENIFRVAAQSRYAVDDKKDEEESTFARTKISISFEKGKGVVVASSGSRAMYAIGAIDYDGTSVEYLISEWLVDSLSKLFAKNADMEILGAETANKYLFKVDEIEIALAKPAESSFKPSIENAIERMKSLSSMSVEMRTQDVLHFIKGSMLEGGRADKVVMYLDAKSSVVRAEHAQNTYYNLLAAKFSGVLKDNMVIGFSPANMEVAYKSIKTPTTIQTFISDTSPSFINVEWENYLITHIILPLRLNESVFEAISSSSKWDKLKTPEPINKPTETTPTTSPAPEFEAGESPEILF
ncbi:MAG: hypothetical protein FWE32_02080 [Oscillospiraceae bacterium]|nr:hypothetical protein [Oscillospiraceae bacterium]